jgi:class 3 adenylate cyclase
MSKQLQICRESASRLLALGIDRQSRMLGVGVNSGMVVAGATGDCRQTRVLGQAVNIAARPEPAVLARFVS